MAHPLYQQRISCSDISVSRATRVERPVDHLTFLRVWKKVSLDYGVVNVLTFQFGHIPSQVKAGSPTFTEDLPNTRPSCWREDEFFALIHVHANAFNEPRQQVAIYFIRYESDIYNRETKNEVTKEYVLIPKHGSSRGLQTNRRACPVGTLWQLNIKRIQVNSLDLSLPSRSVGASHRLPAQDPGGMHLRCPAVRPTRPIRATRAKTNVHIAQWSHESTP